MTKSTIINVSLCVLLVALLFILFSESYEVEALDSASSEPENSEILKSQDGFGLSTDRSSYEEELASWDPNKIEYLDEIGVSIAYDEKMDNEEAVAFVSALSPELAKEYAFSELSLFFKDDSLILVREHYRNPPTYSRFDNFLKVLDERKIISSDFKPAYFLKKNDTEALTFFFYNFSFGHSFSLRKPDKEMFALVTEARTSSRGDIILRERGDDSLDKRSFPAVLTVYGKNSCRYGDGSYPYYHPIEANRNREYALTAYRFDFTDKSKSFDYQAIISESMSIAEPTLEAVKEHGILHPTYPEFTMKPPRRKRPKPSARRENSR